MFEEGCGAGEGHCCALERSVDEILGLGVFVELTELLGMWRRV
jgi:hypothetical protein